MHTIHFLIFQDLIEQRLQQELENLETYLRHAGKPAVIELMDNGATEAKEFYDLSGDTFKWVTVLRAAEVHWNTNDTIVLFRLREEGILGDSPQIIVRCRNR